jgi:SPP1 gp7 family putative phage head morphogenesis protein
LQRIAQRTDLLSSRELTGQIKAKLDLDIVATTPGLSERVSVFTRQNVRLIKSIPEDYLHDVEQTVLRAVREGMRAEDLATILEDRYRVSSNRAALIAQDQVGKFYGEVTQERQRGLGIDGYIWRNVGDERVAGNPGGLYPDAEPSHWDREGTRHKWSDPPEGGHPGQRPRCRCWAEPDLEGLL